MTRCTTTVDRRTFVPFKDGGGISYPGERSHTTWLFDDGVEVHVSLTPSYKTVYPTMQTRYNKARFEAKRNKHARCYVSDKRPFNLLEDLENRTRRPHVVWKPRVVEALARIGVTADQIFWSQKAGCSCGCSPAFILKGVTNEADISVVLPDIPTIDPSKPARIIAAI